VNRLMQAALCVRTPTGPSLFRERWLWFRGLQQ
jgi:hypothetical protein